MFSIMLFIFLCFMGMLAVLFYMLRSQERLCRILRDEHAQMRILLRAMESRLDAYGAQGACEASDGAPEPAPLGVETAPACDPLLHLSFDGPARPGQPGAPARADRPAMDPALDLHFDPVTDSGEVETRR